MVLVVVVSSMKCMGDWEREKDLLMNVRMNAHHHPFSAEDNQIGPSVNPSLFF